MKINVYVDGFNLYYGCLKDTSCKWLDISKLCGYLLPNDEISEIRYYTAKVSARLGDPDQPVRQQIYLRALETIPNLTITYGHFLTHPVRMRLETPPPTGSPFVTVLKTEEKGSDVNLATHLLHDGHLGKYEVAVVITNDSDLQEPIRIVTQELGLKVGLLNPHLHPSRTLLQYSLFFKNIRQKVLKKSQFPTTLIDSNGSFSKPPTW